MGSNTATLGPARDLRCICCGKPAQSWQHRVAAGRGGPTDLFNCVPLCGDGTAGCHGRAESEVAWAQEQRLDIPGSFVRVRYVGPDEAYRWHYNREVWNGTDWEGTREEDQ